MANEKTVNEGERNSALFLECLKLAAIIADDLGHTPAASKQLTKAALKYNSSICKPPLDTSEVKHVCKHVWKKYELKGKNFRHRKKQPNTHVKLRNEFILQLQDAPYPFSLLIWLVSHNRLNRSFPINNAGLQRLMGWSSHHVKKAKAYLIDHEYVEQISLPIRIAGSKGLSADFKFTQKVKQALRREPIKKSKTAEAKR